jgi:hypothetical protein
VNAICALHKRCELFNSFQQEYNNKEILYNFSTLSLRQDGGVCWHSVYLMLQRCLELKEYIKCFIRKLCTTDNNGCKYNPLTDSLNNNEWDCNDAGKTRDPNLAWSHSEAYGSAWENRNLGSIDTYRSCTKGLQETAYLHLGDCNVKYTKAMKC